MCLIHLTEKARLYLAIGFRLRRSEVEAKSSTARRGPATKQVLATAAPCLFLIGLYAAYFCVLFSGDDGFDRKAAEGMAKFVGWLWAAYLAFFSLIAIGAGFAWIFHRIRGSRQPNYGWLWGFFQFCLWGPAILLFPAVLELGVTLVFTLVFVWLLITLPLIVLYWIGHGLYCFFRSER